MMLFHVGHKGAGRKEGINMVKEEDKLGGGRIQGGKLELARKGKREKNDECFRVNPNGNC